MLLFNLIGIELRKLFHKKGIYVIWILIFLFCLINNVLYKVDYDKDGYYIDDYVVDLSLEIKDLENKLLQYDRDNRDDVSMYVELKTELDLLKIQDNYDSRSWQYHTIDYLREVVYNIHYYTYVEDDIEKKEEYLRLYNEEIDKFHHNDWKYFVQIEKGELEEKIKVEEELLDSISDKLEREDVEKVIKEYSNELNILEIRLDNDIDYGVHYLNDALVEYDDSRRKLDQYDNKTLLDYEEKIKYNEIVSNFYISKYIIDNKVNLNQENNLNYLLRTIVEDYELFIIIIILLVAGSIVSEEFHKGTIKLLLIKPFSRSKILLSKYLASIIVLLITILFTILIEVFIGGYLFGFDSLGMKVATYYFDTNMVVSYNIFIYMFLRILYYLPLMIMVLTICFGISVISCNTVISVSLTMLLYIFSQTINSLIYRSNYWLFKYFLTIHWDFRDYLFGGLGKFKDIDFKISFFVYLGYLVVFMVVIFGVFKRKNIKNI